ncbi:unnamed protein product [Bursaphelenchus xylophilus]|uniref:N-acetylgalactosaminide beta-1,3-galactosyltransferase n=1 Tax=Bursaphelenchus xylophilus TaxID=6326 RepID=A0A1I7RNN9_BURXY|nr:unnamed protein product [Bursaphelenchus xylophilus]CAG9124190.1 unnamed protein product [Bursaphelenchus xylophilus]
MNLLRLILMASVASIGCSQHIAVLLITQPWPYELNYAQKFKDGFLNSLEELSWNGTLLKTHSNFDNNVGGWSLWPLLGRLYSHVKDANFLLIVEPFSQVDWTALKRYTEGLNPEEDVFQGKGLIDKKPVIIHHFFGFQGQEKPIKYPDFSAGVLLSRSFLKRVVEVVGTHDKSDFTIDAKFEFAKFIYDNIGTELEHSDKFCLEGSPSCIVTYAAPKYAKDEPGCGNEISKENVFYAVKTFNGYHKTRVLYVKRTWGKEAKYIEFFSDTEDFYVPTIDLKVPNTEIGHCGKTLAIIKHYLSHEEVNHAPWLVIADDDTLLSTTRLHRMLDCLPTSTKVILGERYGFGFDWDGLGGYDYPTGGSGIVISREAARHLAVSCECPQVDSPDDMVIGACARRLNIPILHSPAFHQAQREDYDPSYINKIPPISFHKFENIDPYKEHQEYLYEAEDTQGHTEL